MYFFSGTRWLPWLYRHFSPSALPIGVKFLLSVSSSSNATVRHHCQVVLLHICTTAQDVELRFFRVSRVSAAELEAQPWLGWGITTFWNSCFLSGRQVLASVVLKMWLQRRPATCLSMASWVFGPGCATWHPSRFLTNNFSFLQEVSWWRLSQTNALYFL